MTTETKKPRAQRRALDLYETAPWQVDALVDNLPELRGSAWCPCVGDGSLLRRLRERLPDLGPFVTSDIDPTKPADYHFDATDGEEWDAAILEEGAPDWIIENPPFNAEIDILKCAWKAARVGVVLMARVSFAEPTQARGPWLSTHPYAKRITLERYSFTQNGSTDSATTDWLVWAKPGAVIAPPFGVSAFGYRDREATHPHPANPGSRA